MLLHRYRMKIICLALLVLLCLAVFLLNKSNVFQSAPPISVFRRMIHRHPRPIFPTDYHSTGLLRLPHGNIKEPFEIWFTRKYQRSRVDFYYGNDQTYQRSDLSTYGTAFSVVPMYTEKTGNIKGCWYRNGTKKWPIIPQPIIPNIEEFQFLGVEIVEGTETTKWEHRYNIYDLNNIHTLWVTNRKPHRPVRYEMNGYDSLLATHYDYYVLDYISFEEWKPNVSIYELPTDVWCHNWSHRLDSHLLTNPMQEFMTSSHEAKEEHVELLYSIFRRRHRKLYKNRTQHNERKHLFRHNSRFIHSSNRKNLSYKLSTNHLADIPDKEYLRYHGSNEDPNYFDAHSTKHLDSEHSFNITGIPDSLDWRDYGAVGPVRSQGNCASCYALVAAQAVETIQFLETGHMEILSPQQIMDCSWGSGNEGCRGGWYSKAFSWVFLNSLKTEKSYGPYLAQEGTCHSNNDTKAMTIDAFAYVPKRNNTALKIAIAKYGTAAVSINVSPLTFKFYGWGIYDDPHCDQSDNSHTVVVVGYGIDRGIPYWLIKNSWSTAWGIKGYAKVAWAQNRCGITEKPIVVLTKRKTFQLPTKVEPPKPRPRTSGSKNIKKKRKKRPSTSGSKNIKKKRKKRPSTSGRKNIKKKRKKRRKH